MAYKVKGENGLPIKKSGNFVLGYDIPVMKIEQLDDYNKTFLAVGSTEDEDRDKDIIRVAGWQLDNFKKNPVVPWGHNYYEPSIGKAVSIKKDTQKKRLVFKPQFDKDDDKAMLIFNKYKNGYLNTFSVGFIGLEFAFRDENDKWWGGREFTKQELLEISAVTVPANPNAGVDMRGLENNRPKSLCEFGYKKYMCGIDTGLFYPVSDMELYTNPEELIIGRDVVAIFAHEIDNPESKKSLVGYKFGSTFDDKTITSWIKENAPQKTKVKYFDMKGDIGDALEIVEDEEQISFDFLTDENEDVEESIEENVEGEIEEKEITETETEKPEQIENKDEAVVEEVQEEEKTQKSELDIRLESIEENLKNILEKFNELSKSENREVDESNIFEIDDQTNDEFIELDKSLFPPVSDENNSEESIEIDAEDFKNIGGQFVKTQLERNIKTTLENVLKDFSGKID
jgi:HK97 family phage prohead protease